MKETIELKSKIPIRFLNYPLIPKEKKGVSDISEQEVSEKHKYMPLISRKSWNPEKVEKAIPPYFYVPGYCAAGKSTKDQIFLSCSCKTRLPMK